MKAFTKIPPRQLFKTDIQFLVSFLAILTIFGCTAAPRYTNKSGMSLEREPSVHEKRSSKITGGNEPAPVGEVNEAGMGGKTGASPDEEVKQIPEGYTEIGFASYYGYDCAGQKTANGEKFAPLGMTAAHRTLPFNTLVRVTNQSNGKSVVVRVNDRGPHARNRIIDLAYGAAKQIDLVRAGHAKVKLEVVTQP